MGNDHEGDLTDANAETAEEPPDRRTSPPPDRPGSDGYPSRADSRRDAAVANGECLQPTVEKPENAPEAAQAPQATSIERSAASNSERDSGPPLGGSTENDSGRAEDLTEDRHDRTGGRLTVDGKQVNEYLYPLGGVDAGSDVVGEPWVDPADDLSPSGGELLKMDDEDESRPEKVRKKFFEVVSDAHDITGKAADKGHDIFARPPTGHAETSTAPEVVPPPHDGVHPISRGRACWSIRICRTSR